jgi:hypothetical protein
MMILGVIYNIHIHQANRKELDPKKIQKNILISKNKCSLGDPDPNIEILIGSRLGS